MNTKTIFTTVILSALLATGCSKEYLDTRPTGSTAVSTIFKTPQDANLAINGLAAMMSVQYLDSQGFNGEGTVKMYNGNYPGNHFSVNLPGWSTIINGDY